MFSAEDYVFFYQGAFRQGDATDELDWHCLYMGMPLIFNKFDIYDFVQGLSMGLGLVACFEIIATIVTAWRAKRRRGPGAGGS